MFEVFEDEGWNGHFPQWIVTNEGVPSRYFNSEEAAQEYCDTMNYPIYKCGDEDPDHECCLT